ncbi:hypothetical protein [Campylobacter sp. RM16192]|uniref:hypothetical protein n=1 Tax=Campylobacter sp. RM16192 TaxID=1660080 RepID=UPI001451E549|nr:hypothetical protein [Campylobacter sp. RM16192]QCD52521.1 hypothetical protein CDOMC_0898 [Campylobacter sp. RM16192]
MSRGFNIEYLRAPEFSKGAGVGAAFGAIGDSLMKLGQIGANRQKIDDEKQRYADEKNFNQTKFDWEIQKHKEDSDFNRLKFDKELLAKQAELEVTKGYYDTLGKKYLSEEQERTHKRQQQEAEKAANISMLRKMYPQATKDWSDEEVFAYGNLRQKEKDGKKKSEDIDVPDGYMLTSADEIAPLVGKGIIRGEGFRKVGEGKYIIKKTDLVDTLKEAKTQIEMAQHAADFANDEQEKVIPDVLPKVRDKKEKKKMPEFKFKPGAYDESERDRFGFDIYDGVM